MLSNLLFECALTFLHSWLLFPCCHLFSKNLHHYLPNTYTFINAHRLPPKINNFVHWHPCDWYRPLFLIAISCIPFCYEILRRTKVFVWCCRLCLSQICICPANISSITIYQFWLYSTTHFESTSRFWEGQLLWRAFWGLFIMLCFNLSWSMPKITEYTCFHQPFELFSTPMVVIIFGLFSPCFGREMLD